MQEKKRKKKRLNCFRFFSGHTPPFPRLPCSCFPNPFCSVSSAPAPKSLPLGLGGVWGSGRQSEGTGGHGRRDKETQGRVQAGSGQSPQWEGPLEQGGELQLGDQPWLRRTPGSGESMWLHSHLPAALLLELGPGEGVQRLLGPGHPSQSRAQAELLPLRAGHTQVQLCPLKPSPPQKRRQGGRARHRTTEADRQVPLGLRESQGGETEAENEGRDTDWVGQTPLPQSPRGKQARGSTAVPSPPQAQEP